MRLLRMLGAALGTATLAVAVGPAAANAAAPSAPYDAFTLDGAWNYAFDPSNATITMVMNGSEGVIFHATTTSGHDFTATIAAPTGATLSTGTYTTAKLPDGTNAGLDIAGDSTSCGSAAGSLTIQSITRDSGTNDVTAIAISYHETSCVYVAGELRWQSGTGYKAGLQSPTTVDFGTVDVGQNSTTRTVTVTSAGSDALTLGAATLGGATPGAFAVTANTCTGASLAYGQTCTVSVVTNPQVAARQNATLSIADNSAAGARVVSLAAMGKIGAAGTYYPLASVRLLDTRYGNGAPAGALAANSTLHLQVGGRGGVPSTGVSAVVLNVTVTGGTSASFLTVYPTGVTRPVASNLNFPAGWTGANSVTVPVGTGGKVDIYNRNGSVHVIADVVGFYAGDDSVLSGHGLGGQYQPNTPTRVLDTRYDGGGQLPGGYVLTQAVDYGSTINSHVRALVINVTVVNGGASGVLTVWNGADPLPTSSTLNWTAHAIVPNLAVVPVAPCDFDPSCYGMPSIGIYNNSSSGVDVLVDVFGFIDDSQLSDGLRYHPITPTRIADTRTGQGGSGALGPNTTATLTTPGSVAGPQTYALAMNLTGIGATSDTFISTWAAGAGVSRPTVSNLNLNAGATRSNAAIGEIGPTNQYNVYNRNGTVNLAVDVAGTFDLYPGTASAVFGSKAAALNGAVTVGVGVQPTFLTPFMSPVK